MRVDSLRLAVQHASFAILMYGGRWGLSLGSFLPCFACPYVPTCGGYCYLMALQGTQGLAMPLSLLFSSAGLPALLAFLGFLALVALLGKTWCGWVCPLGLVQDWLASVRKKLNLREARFSVKAKRRLRPVKYLLLVYLAALPLLVGLAAVHPDFSLAFCNICPAKALLPAFAGEFKYFSLDFTNRVTLGFSVILVLFTAASVVGSFYKDRFFCIFCPMLALIHLLKPLSLMGLVKRPQLCHGCGTCRRVCPMDIERVYREHQGEHQGERQDCDVGDEECLGCLKCVESCEVDDTLVCRWGLFKLFTSSRRYAAGKR